MLRILANSRLLGLTQGQLVRTRFSFNVPQRYLPQLNPAAPYNKRAFSNTHILYKKKDKAKKGAASEQSDDDQPSKSTGGGGGGGAPEDPSDLSQLQNDVAASITRLKDDLSKLRAGGRLNTEVIEEFRVHLSKASKDTVKLGELAQVVPKGGRMVTVLAAEEDHIKPITSAIVSSNLSLTPQPDAHNSLQLNIPIPPPTKESRERTVQSAKAALEKAAGAVRDSRGTVNKRLQDMQKKKIARPDDVRKAQDHMEKITEKAQKEVKDLFETAKKALERA